MNTEQMRIELLNIRNQMNILIDSIEKSGQKPHTSDLQKTQADLNYIKKLLASDEWPQAIDPDLICDKSSEEDKIDRANGIIEVCFSSDILNKKKFLDFGCGEGHVAYAAAKHADVSVGYDRHKNFCNPVGEVKNCIVTDDLDVARANGPYDVILAFDVFDHTEDPIGSLKEAKDLLADHGRIHIKFHPWCSRHGGHVYHHINKAYAHLFLSNEDLKLSSDVEHTNKVFYPIKSYDDMIEQAGLRVVSKEITRQKPEDFFQKKSVVKSYLENIFGNSTFPSFQLEQSFLDYIVSK